MNFKINKVNFLIVCFNHCFVFKIETGIIYSTSKMKNLCIFIQICQIAVLSGGQKKSYLRRMCVFPLNSFHIEDVKYFCGPRHPQRVHRLTISKT